ncbi:MAG TPA: hypothetical protein EYM84_10690 [Flavobacteriales bacterium]|nr:hypothetical protein [Flavobacteriales bacterium]
MSNIIGPINSPIDPGAPTAVLSHDELWELSPHKHSTWSEWFKLDPKVRYSYFVAAFRSTGGGYRLSDDVNNFIDGGTDAWLKAKNTLKIDGVKKTMTNEEILKYMGELHYQARGEARYNSRSPFANITDLGLNVDGKVVPSGETLPTSQTFAGNTELSTSADPKRAADFAEGRASWWKGWRGYLDAKKKKINPRTKGVYYTGHIDVENGIIHGDDYNKFIKPLKKLADNIRLMDPGQLSYKAGLELVQAFDKQIALIDANNPPLRSEGNAKQRANLSEILKRQQKHLQRNLNSRIISDKTQMIHKKLVELETQLKQVWHNGNLNDLIKENLAVKIPKGYHMKFFRIDGLFDNKLNWFIAADANFESKFTIHDYYLKQTQTNKFVSSSLLHFPQIRSATTNDIRIKFKEIYMREAYAILSDWEGVNYWSSPIEDIPKEALKAVKDLLPKLDARLSNVKGTHYVSLTSRPGMTKFAKLANKGHIPREGINYVLVQGNGENSVVMLTDIKTNIGDKGEVFIEHSLVKDSSVSLHEYPNGQSVHKYAIASWNSKSNVAGLANAASKISKFYPYTTLDIAKGISASLDGLVQNKSLYLDDIFEFKNGVDYQIKGNKIIVKLFDKVSGKTVTKEILYSAARGATPLEAVMKRLSDQVDSGHWTITDSTKFHATGNPPRAWLVLPELKFSDKFKSILINNYGFKPALNIPGMPKLEATSGSVKPGGKEFKFIDYFISHFSYSKSTSGTGAAIANITATDRAALNSKSNIIFDSATGAPEKIVAQQIPPEALISGSGNNKKLPMGGPGSVQRIYFHDTSPSNILTATGKGKKDSFVNLLRSVITPYATEVKSATTTIYPALAVKAETAISLNPDLKWVKVKFSYPVFYYNGQILFKPEEIIRYLQSQMLNVSSDNTGKLKMKVLQDVIDSLSDVKNPLLDQVHQKRELIRIWKEGAALLENIKVIPPGTEIEIKVSGTVDPVTNKVDLEKIKKGEPWVRIESAAMTSLLDWPEFVHTTSVNESLIKTVFKNKVLNGINPMRWAQGAKLPFNPFNPAISFYDDTMQGIFESLPRYQVYNAQTNPEGLFKANLQLKPGFVQEPYSLISSKEIFKTSDSLIGKILVQVEPGVWVIKDFPDNIWGFVNLKPDDIKLFKRTMELWMTNIVNNWDEYYNKMWQINDHPTRASMDILVDSGPKASGKFWVAPQRKLHFSSLGSNYLTYFINHEKFVLPILSYTPMQVATVGSAELIKLDANIAINDEKIRIIDDVIDALNDAMAPDGEPFTLSREKYKAVIHEITMMGDIVTNPWDIRGGTINARDRFVEYYSKLFLRSGAAKPFGIAPQPYHELHSYLSKHIRVIFTIAGDEFLKNKSAIAVGKKTLIQGKTTIGLHQETIDALIQDPQYIDDIFDDSLSGATLEGKDAEAVIERLERAALISGTADGKMIQAIKTLLASHGAQVVVKTLKVTITVVGAGFAITIQAAAIPVAGGIAVGTGTNIIAGTYIEHFDYDYAPAWIEWAAADSDEMNVEKYKKLQKGAETEIDRDMAKAAISEISSYNKTTQGIYENNGSQLQAIRGKHKIHAIIKEYFDDGHIHLDSAGNKVTIDHPMGHDYVKIMIKEELEDAYGVHVTPELVDQYIKAELNGTIDKFLMSTLGSVFNVFMNIGDKAQHIIGDMFRVIGVISDGISRSEREVIEEEIKARFVGKDMSKFTEDDLELYINLEFEAAFKSDTKSIGGEALYRWAYLKAHFASMTGYSPDNWERATEKEKDINYHLNNTVQFADEAGKAIINTLHEAGLWLWIIPAFFSGVANFIRENGFDSQRPKSGYVGKSRRWRNNRRRNIITQNRLEREKRELETGPVNQRF